MAEEKFLFPLLKRDPHDRDLSAFQKPKQIRLWIIFTIASHFISLETVVSLIIKTLHEGVASLRKKSLDTRFSLC